jgi:hypothetical protein
VDIGSNIVGSFNQANLASQKLESDKSRARNAEDDRIRDARRRSVSNQEEVTQTEVLRDLRVEADKQGSRGRAARDQYEAHEEFSRHTPGRRSPQELAARSQSPGEAKPSTDAHSGHLVDIEA